MNETTFMILMICAIVLQIANLVNLFNWRKRSRALEKERLKRKEIQIVLKDDSSEFREFKILAHGREEGGSNDTDTDT